MNKHVKNMSGGLVGQIIVRVLVGLVSVATAFTLNVVAPQQASMPSKDARISATKRSAAKPIIQPHASGVVRQTSLSSNEYGAHWDTIDGTQAFVDGNGDVFAKNAKGVIDVSEHQHTIDWDAVKASGIDGAIIRISYGWDNGYDKQALRNIRECKRLGIPFGIYIYSYAEKAEDGAAEGADVVSLLQGAGVSPEDLTYPVYYDLEKWSWRGHTPPTSPYVYQDIVASWWNQLVSAGYNKLGVYSYTNYLRGPLNSAYIHERTSWVGSYGTRTGFPYSTALRGWQYTSNGSIDGIEGRVDMNAFGMYDGSDINGVSEAGNSAVDSNSKSEGNDGTSNGYSNGSGSSKESSSKSDSKSSSRTSSYNKKSASDYYSYDVRDLPSINIPGGEYFINSMLRSTLSIDIPGASKSNGAKLQLYSWNNSGAQKFNFERQKDGTYFIRNKNSGKVLDVRYASPSNGGTVWQYTPNGSLAQRWLLRDSGSGYFIQSALGNWVLDITGANPSNGTSIKLYRPNANKSQLFVPSSTSFLNNSDFSIKSALNNSMAMDIRWGGLGDHAPLQIYKGNKSKAQLFKFLQVGNGLYSIFNHNSKKVLDVPGASFRNGIKLQQYAYNGSSAQNWALWKYPDNTYTFISMCSGKAIDIPGARAVNGQRVQTYTPNSTAAQRWKFE